jgi:undecaprenyl-diphosphatase
MAFPSEHAALMFGLASTVWLADRRLGAIGFALACCLVTARVYLGFVFPTDIVTGAMLGVLAAGLAQAPMALGGAGRIVRWGEWRQGAFAALSFYVCFGISRLFEDYRYVAAGVMHLLRSHLRH